MVCVLESDLPPGAAGTQRRDASMQQVFCAFDPSMARTLGVAMPTIKIACFNSELLKAKRWKGQTDGPTALDARLRAGHRRGQLRRRGARAEPVARGGDAARRR